MNKYTGNFIDSRDGKEYRTIKIGNQTWLTTNLAYKSNSGCCAFDNDEKNISKYGYLYNWETANQVCPNGWRLPTLVDFDNLVKHFGGEGQNLFKSLIKGGVSGFGVVMSGAKYPKGDFSSDNCAQFWTSTEDESKYAWALYFSEFNRAFRDSGPKECYFSIRCIKS